MEIKKQTNILITPETHLRLKINAAMLRLTIGDLVAYMTERLFPFPTTEIHMNFTAGVKKQIEEEKEEEAENDN